jgi:hypothetical protein
MKVLHNVLEVVSIRVQTFAKEMVIPKQSIQDVMLF